MTIAASDSAAGAGIAADLKTMSALGVYGTWAITSITAQNTHEIRSVQPLPGALVRDQIETVLDDLAVGAVKTGMLATAEIVSTVADIAAQGRLPHLVVDPVVLSSTGGWVFAPESIELFRYALVPTAEVFTPNLLEAAAFLGRELHTLADQREAALELGDWGATITVVKGGWAVQDRRGEAVDVLWNGEELLELPAPRIATANNHGSGCSFAAAIAAGLAQKMTALEAIRRAKSYVHQAIAGGADWHLGAGHGPLDHFGWRLHDYFGQDPLDRVASGPAGPGAAE
jgi:hydroxymethylpyrimidine/phosphomethylpyrimidine kinase